MEHHLPSRRLRTSSAIAAWLLAGVSAACSTSAAKPSTVDYDFLGVVEQAAIAAPPAPRGHGFGADEEWTYGGPDTRFLVGPGTMTLFNGTELQVPADTPGPETCLSVDAERAVNEACLVIGARRDDGTVEWFGVLPAQGSAEPADDGWRARFPVWEVRAESVLFHRGVGYPLWYEVPLAPTVTNLCVQPVARVPREEFAASPPVAAAYEAVVDLDTTTVISVECFYVD